MMVDRDVFLFKIRDRLIRPYAFETVPFLSSSFLVLSSSFLVFQESYLTFVPLFTISAENDKIVARV